MQHRRTRSTGRKTTHPFPFHVLDALAQLIVEVVFVRPAEFLTDWLLSRRFMLRLRERYSAWKYLQRENGRA